MNIRIISPAGKVDPDVVRRGVETLQAWGHTVTLAPHALTEYGRYAATPEDRTADLLEALKDPMVDLLWCARGGYGCMHLLDQIPLEEIAARRKWVVGYSDITALHALWLRAGVHSLHAPMMKHLGEAPEHETSLSLRHWLATGQLPTLTFPSHPDNQPGCVEGRIVGGNLAVLSALHGTPYDFDYQDALLFIEDIGESPYKIDRMVRTLRLAGVFQQVRGLVVGQFTGCEADPLMPESLTAAIRHAVGRDLPIAFGAPVGHVLENYPLAEGAWYRLCVGKGATVLTPL
jgi:muramoyltetrapeptide carboxypeptidase